MNHFPTHIFREDMMRPAATTLIALLAALPASAGFAAEPHDAQDWSGFYAGVFGGFGTSRTTLADPAGVGGSLDLTASGGLAGATLGYNLQWNQAVLGLEGQLGAASLNTGKVAVFGGSLASRIDWLTSLRARAGISIDQMLVFATAGYSAAGVTTEGSSALGNKSDNATFGGYTAGGGVEVAVSDTVTVKGEYQYFDLGLRNDGGAISGNPAQSLDIHPAASLITFGINLRF